MDGEPEWNVQEQRWQDEDKAGAQDQLQLAGHVTPQSHQGQPQGCVPVQSSPGLHKDTNAVQGGEEQRGGEVRQGQQAEDESAQSEVGQEPPGCCWDLQGSREVKTHTPGRQAARPGPAHLLHVGAESLESSLVALRQLPHVPGRGSDRTPFAPFAACVWAGNVGIPENHFWLVHVLEMPLLRVAARTKPCAMWFSLRGPPGSFPHSLQSTRKKMACLAKRP